MKPRFLLIQTAFIGDAILMTPLIETIKENIAESEIDVLVEKKSESLFLNHPKIRELLVLDKSSKFKNIIKLLRLLRTKKYDYVINCQRFMSSGLLTFFSGGRITIGFKKNPISPFFTFKVAHKFSPEIHEVDRNLGLLDPLFQGKSFLKIRSPKLYPSSEDQEKVTSLLTEPYICLAPSSVWYTKQFPVHKWVELIEYITNKHHFLGKIYLLGAANDRQILEEIKKKANTSVLEIPHLTLLQAAYLMKNAEMNFVNDSAPLHLASSQNAPTTAFFCSTVPEFGFTPLSEKSYIIENKGLICRPCGLHGYKSCPRSHFKCAEEIRVEECVKF